MTTSTRVTTGRPHPAAAPPPVTRSGTHRVVLPTLRDIAGLPPDPSLPGHSLLDPIDRPVLSEYHAQGMPDAGYLLKSGPWKYSYYGPAHPPQLFNLETDPDELHDLSGDRERVSELDAELRLILDPVRTDVQAKNDQAARAAR